MALLMKKGEFAARMKVGPSAVSNWGKRGLLVYGEDPDRPGKQLVDAEKSELLIRGTIDPTLGRPSSAARSAAEEPGDTAQATTNRPPVISGAEALRQEDLRERILTRRIENERTVGGLVFLAEVERRVGEMGRLTRERTHAVIRQLAERVAAETEPRRITALLIEALDKMFASLADEIEADAKAEIVADATLAALDDDEAEEAADSDTG